jgi:Leucine-rich repeat (LRR) protein
MQVIMSNKICLSSNAFLEALATVPAEDWYRNWPADRTIMLSMTSKEIRDIINNMNIPAIVHWKWKFWSDPHNGSTEVKLNLIITSLQHQCNLYLYKITTVVLRCCNIQIIVKKLAKVLKNCPMLEKLDLQRNKINTKGAVLIAKSLKKCSKLLHIDFYINKIGDEGAVKITKLLKYCPHLSYLNLSFNMIYDKGIEKLVKIIIESGNQSLNDIEVCHNRIKEDGVISLMEMLKKCPNIKYLNFCYNTIEQYKAENIAQRYNIDLHSLYKLRKIIYP